jgi:hypothetical protein
VNGSAQYFIPIPSLLLLNQKIPTANHCHETARHHPHGLPSRCMAAVSRSAVGRLDLT